MIIALVHNAPPGRRIVAAGLLCGVHLVYSRKVSFVNYS